MSVNNDFIVFAYPSSFTRELNIRVFGTQECIAFDIINSNGDFIYSDVLSERMKIETSLFPPDIYFLRYKKSRKFHFIKVRKLVKHIPVT